MDKPKLTGLVPDRLAPKSARIIADSIEVMTDIGFHDFEIGTPQRLSITVEVWLEQADVPADDDPAGAWDYDHVRRQVIELAGERRYNLQETLARAVYDRLGAMRGVKALRVSTSKPDVYGDTRAVGVELASFTGGWPDR